MKSGITFKYLSRYFELVDVEWGNDNSFYFLPRQREAEIGNRIDASIDANDELVINVNSVKRSGFPRRKITRHPSGYYHIKDVVGRGGRREKDGLRGLPLSTTDGFHPFLLIAPQSIETLQQIPSPNPAHIVTHLPADIQPFTVQFAVQDKARSGEVNFKPGQLLGNRVISIELPEHKYRLVVMHINLGVANPSIRPEFPARYVLHDSVMLAGCTSLFRRCSQRFRRRRSFACPAKLARFRQSPLASP